MFNLNKFVIIKKRGILQFKSSMNIHCLKRVNTKSKSVSFLIKRVAYMAKDFYETKTELHTRN